MKRLLLREAREQPLLLIFEDLHWIDSETQALLDGLVESLGSARLLLLVNYRPEYQHAWGSKTYYSQMRLDALPAESAGELLDALLGDDPGLAPLKQLLVKRGNPFFLEETVRTLVETKALDGAAGPVSADATGPGDPGPGHGPGDAGGAHRPAAAGGQAPPAGRLRRRQGRAVRAARRRSPSCRTRRSVADSTTCRPPSSSTRRGLFPDLEYTFKHALTHEVDVRRTAAGAAPRASRADRRARSRRSTGIASASRSSGSPITLSGASCGRRRCDYLRQAGLKAAARSALQDARVWFEQALGVLEALPESPSTLEQAFEIRLELRPVLILLGEVRRALERLREAEALAERLNDDRRRGRVCAFMTNAHSLLGELDEALATGTRALAIAGRSGT